MTVSPVLLVELSGRAFDELADAGDVAVRVAQVLADVRGDEELPAGFRAHAEARASIELMLAERRCELWAARVLALSAQMRSALL